MLLNVRTELLSLIIVFPRKGNAFINVQYFDLKYPPRAAYVQNIRCITQSPELRVLAIPFVIQTK